MELGLVVVADCKKEAWNASVCKNTAHQLGMLGVAKSAKADDRGATVSALPVARSATAPTAAASSATVSTAGVVRDAEEDAR